jgi:hypothetical protein
MSETDNDSGKSPNNEGNEESKGRLESLIPGLVRRAIASGAEVLGDEKVRDSVVAEIVRRAVIKGNEVVDVTEDSVRKLVGDFPIAKEVADRVSGRFDDYRSDITRLVKEELQEFLQRIDIGTEIQKALTSLSLEVSTEIRFIPNDKKVNSKLLIKPQIKTKTKVKKARSKDSEGDEGTQA